MAWLKKNTNLAWSGFYLGKSPSHSGTSWMKARAELVGQGWGLAPIYVGQQVTGPGSRIVTAEQGGKDGANACELMTSARFPHASFVYLDLENGPPFTPGQRNYVGAWVDAVKANGFSPGVYCSFLFADEVHELREDARIWAFHVSTTTPHHVPGPNYPNPDPAVCGYPAAFMWQLGDECRISLPEAPGGVIEVDLDSAISPDPSQ
jgi:hypothetical protein